MFHRIESVQPLPDKRILVRFADNTLKYYDMEPLFNAVPAFQQLENVELFNSVRKDIGGYGIVWNDDIDLSCNELWEHGKNDESVHVYG